MTPPSLSAREGLREGFARIRQSLARDRSLKIVMLNDYGFVAGAGNALRRQVQSLLIDGHSVGVICGLEGADRLSPDIHGRRFGSDWLGTRVVTGTAPEHGVDRNKVADTVVEEVVRLKPDLVVTGNFHIFRWPVSIPGTLASLGIPSIVYLHDMHWITGRCVHARTCRRYLDGCDHRCPTAGEYPALPPDLIAAAWEERRRVFLDVGVPIAANSRWTASRASEAFGGKASVSLLHLGLDTRRFSPIDRGVARRMLGLEDRPTVVLGAMDLLMDPFKGGSTVREVAPRLSAEGIQVVAFGFSSDRIPSVRSLGPIRDERIMPVVMSAADLFLSVSIEESFGQTLMEAAACGVPTVAVSRGGIPDIARDGVNARLLAEGDPATVLAAVREVLADDEGRAAMGKAGRRLVEREFSLEAQADRWRTFLGSHEPGERR
jgi:glycosyltransferase involved in cell wall biosynthesis